MDNDKKKKILAFVLTAIISLIISVAATLLGIDPDVLGDAMPNGGGVDVSDVEVQ